MLGRAVPGPWASDRRPGPQLSPATPPRRRADLVELGVSWSHETPPSRRFCFAFHARSPAPSLASAAETPHLTRWMELKRARR